MLVWWRTLDQIEWHWHFVLTSNLPCWYFILFVFISSFSATILAFLKYFAFYKRNGSNIGFQHAWIRNIETTSKPTRWPVGPLFLVHRHSSVPVPCFVLLLVAAGRWHEIYTTYIMLGVIVPCRGGRLQVVTCSSPATTRRSNTSSILGLAKLASPFMGIPVHFPPELDTLKRLMLICVWLV